MLYTPPVVLCYVADEPASEEALCNVLRRLALVRRGRGREAGAAQAEEVHQEQERLHEAGQVIMNPTESLIVAYYIWVGFDLSVEIGWM